MLKQLALAKIVARYPKVLGLQDLLTRDLKSLDIPDFARVFEALEVRRPPSPDLVKAAHAFFAGQGIHNAADLIQSPEAIEELIAMAIGGLEGFSALQDRREGLSTQPGEEEFDYGRLFNS